MPLLDKLFSINIDLNIYLCYTCLGNKLNKKRRVNMQEFILVLGQPNNYLPGKLWTQYMVTVLDDRMKFNLK